MSDDSQTADQRRQAGHREVIENWALWRDAGTGTASRPLARRWLDDGDVVSGPGAQFIEVSREGFEKGVSILHFLGGFTCDVAGNRAIAQTKMTINQRAVVDGVEVDVVCTGRFYDFLEKRRARWGIVRRQPIYEKDRNGSGRSVATSDARRALLAKFPEGYRHLAYLQSKIGFTVKGNLPDCAARRRDAVCRGRAGSTARRPARETPLKRQKGSTMPKAFAIVLRLSLD